MSDPNEPAFPGYSDPFVTADDGVRHLRSECGLPQEPSMGLTKRELLAAMAMQGLVANQFGWDVPCGALAFEAVKQADALIAQLNRPKGGDA